MSSTTEVFAAMKEAVSGAGGKSLQRKFKVSLCIIFRVHCFLSWSNNMFMW